MEDAGAGDGYLDLQVNGFGGVDFNADDLSLDAMHMACERMRDDGASAFLPTLITGPLDRMASRLQRIAAYREADPLIAELVAGVHIEGPFISPEEGYVGAHPADAVRPATRSDMQRLLDAADGLTRIVTLAPEHDADFAVTRMLVEQGVVVAAGHTQASREVLCEAAAAGLSMFTHLGNGCPKMLPRHDNIIEWVLSLSDRLWISFIADGAHVPYPALGNYLRAAGIERCVVVSDAISATGLGPGRYEIGGQVAIVGDDSVPRAPDDSHFVGSATSLAQMADRLQRELSLSAEDVAQLTCLGPQSILDGQSALS